MPILGYETRVINNIISVGGGCSFYDTKVAPAVLTIPVGGNLVINKNPLLKFISLYSSASTYIFGILATMGGYLNVSDCPLLANVSIPKIKTIEGDAMISNCSSMNTGSFPGLSSIGGTQFKTLQR